MSTTGISSINDIKNAYYINLEKRTDRKQYVENELNKMGIKAERFNAIKLSHGALGCSMSHLKCIENAKENGWDHVLVVEDDIKFLDKDLFTKQLNKFLKFNKNWDVILFAGNNHKPYIQYGDFCVKVFRCQTTKIFLMMLVITKKYGKYSNPIIRFIFSRSIKYCFLKTILLSK